MSTSKWISYWVIVFLLTVIIPVSIFYLPLTKEVNETELLAIILGFFTITTGVIVASIQYYVDVLKEQNELLKKNELENIRVAIQSIESFVKEDKDIKISTATWTTVYDRLKKYVKEAKTKVDLMYFGSNPPTKGYPKSSSKEQYLQAIDQEILSKSKNIRRIVLHTPANKGWIKEMADRYKNNDRFSLYIIQNEESLNLISAQIIDDHVTILMNLKDSSNPSDPRDIIIDSRTVVKIVENYYKSVISRSKPIIINGVLNDTNYSRYLN